MKPALAVDLRKRELAQIHIGKTALGLDDDEYRDLVFVLSKGQTRSARDLDWTGRKLVLDHFRKLGWRNTGVKPRDPTSRKIRHLWLKLRDAGALRDASERALRHFVARTVHVDRLEWMSSHQAAVVIEALKSWVGRTETGGADGAG